jgi:hypothetical protein
MGIAALAASLASVGGLCLAAAGSSQPDGPPVPFDPGVLAGIGPDGRRATLPRASGEVILYVSQSCLHCRQELESWATSFSASGFARLPLVVLSSGSDPSNTSYLPTVFSESWSHDRDGEIARRLEIGAVPFIAVFDDGGTVVEARAGRSSDQRIRELLHRLNP